MSLATPMSLASPMSLAKRHLNPKLDMNNDIAGIKIPDSKMARDLTQLIRDTESHLLFHHSTRVYLFGALTGERKGLKFDPELLYVALAHYARHPGAQEAGGGARYLGGRDGRARNRL